MSEQLWWYIARSSGIVALVLSGASVIWGLLLATKLTDGRPSPRWLLDLHKWLGGCAVVFTLIHVVALVLDPFVSFGLLDIVLPGAASWNPAAVAWGVVAGWLLMAVQVTSMFMRRLPRRLWKVVHLGSYGVFWSGIVHGALAGTDAANPVYIAVIGLMALAVTFLTGYRALTLRRSRPRAALAS